MAEAKKRPKRSTYICHSAMNRQGEMKRRD